MRKDSYFHLSNGYVIERIFLQNGFYFARPTMLHMFTIYHILELRLIYVLLFIN